MRSLTAVFLLFAAASCAMYAQETSSPDTIRSTSKEVLIDFVVRGSNGQMVRDLRADEVEVYENDVKQKINLFELVQGKRARATEERTLRETTTKAGNGVNIRDFDIVSIVFSRLSPSERPNALAAVEAFLKNDLKPNMLVGIFQVTNRLYAWKPYTNQFDSLREVAKRAIVGSHDDLRNASAAALANSELAVTGGDKGASLGTSIDTKSPAAATAQADFGTSPGAQLTYALLNQERQDDAHARAMDMMDSLENLIGVQAQYPGRKVVIMLTSGLPVSPGFRDSFQQVISAANRAGVTFYGVSVAGLEAQSRTAASVANLKSAAAASNSQRIADASSNSSVIRSAARQDDTMLFAVHGNDRLNLRELAEKTGGFLIEDTNDFKRPMTKILEDVAVHYEIAYAPEISVYDGSYRKLEVRVKRPRVTVQSRSGYFALPEIEGRQIKPFEAGALAVLSEKVAPKDVAFRVSALRFHPGLTVQYAYVAELSGSDVAAQENTADHTRTVNTVVLTLIKNADGEVVQKISKEFAVTLRADQWPLFQKGKMIYAQPFYLPPGRYSMESAVVDRVSKKSAVRRAVLVVPARSSGPEISNVALVRSVQSVPAGESDADPLYVTTNKITPTLSGSVETGTQPHFYAMPYPSGTQANVRLYAEFSRDGKLVERQTLQPTAKTDSGLALLFTPSQELTPGVYDVTLMLAEGDIGARQSLSVVVQ